MTLTPPSDELDLFSDAVLDEPYAAYRRLQELGDVVWLPKCQAFALTRHDVIRRVLLDSETYSSAQGVSLNPEINAYQQGSMLGSDPPMHTKLRALLGDSFSADALREQQAGIESMVDQLLERAARAGRFDAVRDVASVLPAAVIADMIGLPKAGRHRVLNLGRSYFNAFGPPTDGDGNPSARVAGAWAEMQTASAYIGFMFRRLSPVGLGARLLAARDRAELDDEQALKMLSTFIGAGADTTVRTIGNAFKILADHPQQWRLLCDEPQRAAAAVSEILRFDSPSQMLARHVTRDAELAGFHLPAGARVLVIYAAANRDDRAFPAPDVFDIRRSPSPGQLSFSLGIHGCPGQRLARLEVQCVLQAMLRHFSALELDGPPVRDPNSVLRGYKSLPMRVTPRRGAMPGRGEQQVEVEPEAPQ
jgi:cytochrome P450